MDFAQQILIIISDQHFSFIQPIKLMYQTHSYLLSLMNFEFLYFLDVPIITIFFLLLLCTFLTYFIDPPIGQLFIASLFKQSFIKIMPQVIKFCQINAHYLFHHHYNHCLFLHSNAHQHSKKHDIFSLEFIIIIILKS